MLVSRVIPSNTFLNVCYMEAWGGEREGNGNGEWRRKWDGLRKGWEWRGESEERRKDGICLSNK